MLGRNIKILGALLAVGIVYCVYQNEDKPHAVLSRNDLNSDHDKPSGSYLRRHLLWGETRGDNASVGDSANDPNVWNDDTEVSMCVFPPKKCYLQFMMNLL